MSDIHVQGIPQQPLQRQTPVATTVTQRHQVSGQGQQMGKEMKDQGEELLQSGERGLEQLKQVGEQAYHKACDVCHNWRHYPKLLTTVVLLSAFLLGSLTTGCVQKMGILGGSRNYVSTHWDKDTANAHHALDLVIDQLKHPHLYQGQKSTSYVNQARVGLMNLFNGILPGQKTKTKMGMGGKWGGKSAPMFDPQTGRRLTGKMQETMQDIGDTASDIYKRGVGTVKSTGSGIGRKIGNVASSVKGVFSSGDDYEDEHTSSSWFGGENINQDDEEHEEFVDATEKLKHIINRAEREQ